jgi:hypothetical protein
VTLEAAVVTEATAPTAAPAATAAAVLEVPRARGRIVPAGRFRVEVWDGAASTHTLLDREGHGAVPVNEARLLWGDGMLYLFFYAGDLDLQARVKEHDGPIWKDDSVEMQFGEGGERRVVRVSVTGVVSDGKCPEGALDLSDPRCDLHWESGTRAATDYDGTLNSIEDRDEEWAVEAAIPLASIDAAGTWIPGARIPFRVGRCEIAHDGPRACGAWAGTLVLTGAMAPREPK